MTPVVLMFALCVLGCGSTHEGAERASRISSSAASTDGSIRRSIKVTSVDAVGDYDQDDYSSGSGGDADNDEFHAAKDGDNDTDNQSKSYYDRDDRDIRYFGHAASVSERRAVAGMVKRYFLAAGAENGALACSMIVSQFAQSIPEDLGRPPGPVYARGKTCATVVTEVFRQWHRQLAAYPATLRVTGVRLKGAHGFAVLGFRDLPGRVIAVLRQAGVWKMGTLLDSELP